MMYHTPVLLHDCIDGLNIQPNGVYVDVTFGGGGHSKEILKHLAKGALYGFDQDADATQNSITHPNFTLIPANFRYLENFTRYFKLKGVDGILADLGISSHQIDTASRGFSIRSESELDMRMDQKASKTAEQVINEYPENKLREVLRAYGEIKRAGAVAREIVKERSKGAIKTTSKLMEAISSFAPKHKENKFMAQVFQAIRIEVNDEMDALKEMLEQSIRVLNTGGRLVVISYHSLEDTLVKNIMRSGNLKGVVEKDFYGNPQTPFKQITKKPIVASEEEVANNNRARSAKLRIAEKIEQA